MEKNELIDALIKNEYCQFGEDDRDFLESCEVSALEKMNVPAPTANTGQDKATVTVNSSKPGEPQKPKTLEELIDEADESTKDMLVTMSAEHTERKKELIEIITANEKNVFSKEELDDKKLSELKAIATLAAKPETGKLNFKGQGDVNINESSIGPLPIPMGVMTEKKD